MPSIRTPNVLRFVFLLVLMGLTWAQAQSEIATPQLIVKPLETQIIGAPVDVKATLIGRDDRPLDNNVLELYLDGVYVRRARTQADGTASIRISRDVALGTHTVTVAYIGTRDYAATQVVTPLTVRPALLTIETVPPLAGIAFALGEQRFVSDESGRVQVELVNPGTYTLEALVDPDMMHTPDTKISFARWNDAVFTPKRTLDFTNGDLHLQIGFELSHPVRLSFVDLAKEPVAWSRVSSVTLKSSAAAYRTITQEQQPYWLQTNRIMRQRIGIFPTPLLWSVESVLLDGSNVVNRYQQRFYVKPNDVWRLSLLLYQARISTKDALFGLPVGEGITLTYPDGVSKELAFDDDKELFMNDLARGLYKMQVTGVEGVTPVTPVAMTRDQDVELKVLTGWNIALLIAVGLLLGFGMLFYGRPYLIGLRARPVVATKSAPILAETRRLATSSGSRSAEAAALQDSEAGIALTPAFKAQVVSAYLRGEKSLEELANRYELRPALIKKWAAAFLEAEQGVPTEEVGSQRPQPADEQPPFTEKARLN